MFTTDRRLALDDILRELCDNVYFQPPANVQMVYPAIVYQRDRADTKHGDNKPYSVTKKYSVTLIAKLPDEAIFEALTALPMCTHQRFFVVDNLNHDIFYLYF